MHLWETPRDNVTVGSVLRETFWLCQIILRKSMWTIIVLEFNLKKKMKLHSEFPVTFEATVLPHSKLDAHVLLLLLSEML